MTEEVFIEGFIEGWVYCETEDDIHQDVPDPYEKGPIHPAGAVGFDPEEHGFHLLTDHAGFSGTYLHYICPGPHHQLRRVT